MHLVPNLNSQDLVTQTDGPGTTSTLQRASWNILAIERTPVQADPT